MKHLNHETLVKEGLRAKDLPKSWNLSVPGDDETPITVIVKLEPDKRRHRPLSSFLGSGANVHGSAEQVDKHIRQLRDEWEN